MSRCIIRRIRTRLLFELQSILWHSDVVRFQHQQWLCINADTIMRYFRARRQNNYSDGQTGIPHRWQLNKNSLTF